MNFEYQQTETDKGLQHYQDQSCIEDFFKSDNFVASYYDSETEDILQIKGSYELDFCQEDTSFAHAFGNQTQGFTYIERVHFFFAQAYINDVKVTLQPLDLQRFLNDVENEIINSYEN